MRRSIARCVRAEALAVSLGVLLWACNVAGPTDDSPIADQRPDTPDIEIADPDSGPEIKVTDEGPSTLRIAGVVAVGDRIGNAHVRVICGAYDSIQNIGYPATTAGIEAGNEAGNEAGAGVGFYTMTIEEPGYIDDCRQHGIRAQAVFRLESDGSENRRLFSGIATSDGAQATVNINPFTDSGVRMTLSRTEQVAENGWMSAQPAPDRWQTIAPIWRCLPN